MVLPASDTFSGTANQGLTAYSANWGTTTGNGLECDGSGNARATWVSVDNAHKWVGDTFAADHWSEAIIDVQDQNWAGAACRYSTEGNLYGVYSDDNELIVYEEIGDVWAQLGSIVTVSWGTGDHTLRITAVGTLLTVAYDASQTTRTDASHASGGAGVVTYTGVDPGLGLIRSWSANNVSATVAVVCSASVGVHGTATPSLAVTTVAPAVGATVVTSTATHAGTALAKADTGTGTATVLTREATTAPRTHVGAGPRAVAGGSLTVEAVAPVGPDTRTTATHATSTVAVADSVAALPVAVIAPTRVGVAAAPVGASAVTFINSDITAAAVTASGIGLRAVAARHVTTVTGAQTGAAAAAVITRGSTTSTGAHLSTQPRALVTTTNPAVLGSVSLGIGGRAVSVAHRTATGLLTTGPTPQTSLARHVSALAPTSFGLYVVGVDVTVVAPTTVNAVVTLAIGVHPGTTVSHGAGSALAAALGLHATVVGTPSTTGYGIGPYGTDPYGGGSGIAAVVCSVGFGSRVGTLLARTTTTTAIATCASHLHATATRQNTGVGAASFGSYGRTLILVESDVVFVSGTRFGVHPTARALHALVPTVGRADVGLYPRALRSVRINLVPTDSADFDLVAQPAATFGSAVFGVSGFSGTGAVGTVGNWVAWYNSTVQWSGTDPAAGNGCMLITTTPVDSSGDWGIQLNNWPGWTGPEPGVEYAVTFKAKISAGTPNSITLGVFWKDEAGTTLGSVGVDVTTSNSVYTRASEVRTTAPTGTTRLWLQMTGQHPGGAQLRIDQIEVAKVLTVADVSVVARLDFGTHQRVLVTTGVAATVRAHAGFSVMPTVGGGRYGQGAYGVGPYGVGATAIHHTTAQAAASAGPSPIVIVTRVGDVLATVNGAFGVHPIARATVALSVVIVAHASLGVAPVAAASTGLIIQAVAAVHSAFHVSAAGTVVVVLTPSPTGKLTVGGVPVTTSVAYYRQPNAVDVDFPSHTVDVLELLTSVPEE